MTANQGIKPITCEINANGHIQIGGCDLVELADRYATPLYVYDEETIRTIAREYKSAFRDYPNIKMYIMSVNPIYEDKINRWEKTNKRTVKKIEMFNDIIQDELKDSDLNNVYYCDAYNTIDFSSDDGLHYTQGTNREIINYIANKCINFK